MTEDERGPDRVPDASPDETVDTPRDRGRTLLVVIFTTTTFISASLLFLVQPMVAKMLLPLLGGSAAVWNTAAVFFQATLLAGYLFSHLSLRHLGVRRQPWAQLAIAMAGLVALPIAVPAGWAPPSEWPGPWTLLVLGAMVGLPFFVLSTVSPTLQRWFSTTDHPHADDPYFLYAAGNVGSLLALLAFPFVAEPLVSLATLASAWAVGYATFVVLLGACWALARRHAAGSASPRAERAENGPEAPATPLTFRTRIRWVGFAAVPSGLLLGVTRHLASDVAAMPLLWVVPLALYLLTFVVAFGRYPERAVRGSSRALKILVIPLTLSFFGFLSSIEVGIALHLATFTAAALVAHGRLSLERPPADRLTDFYLMLSVGGVVGGATAALLAPVVFSSVLEYPLFLLAALAILPPSAFPGGSKRPDRWTVRTDGVPVAIAFGAAVLSVAVRSSGTQQALVTSMLVAAGGATVAYALARRSAAFTVAIGVILAAGLLVPANPITYQSRTFYGVHRVYVDQANNDRHVLLNGSTVHGMEDYRGPTAGRPTTYYHPAGPVGRWFTATAERSPRRISVIGLGSGALAWYGREGDRFTFYEIDAAVVHIARDRSLFTFLSDSEADVDVEVGDGRLLLERTRAPRADTIVVDAFSGDSIPAHLLTDEAVELYLDRLSPDGTLVFHISNRFFDFRPVVARLAAEHRLVAYVGVGQPTPEAASQGALASTWVVMARSSADTGIDDAEGWTPLRASGDDPLWTDDRSDLLTLMRRG